MCLSSFVFPRHNVSLCIKVPEFFSKFPDHRSPAQVVNICSQYCRCHARIFCCLNVYIKALVFVFLFLICLSHVLGVFAYCADCLTDTKLHLGSYHRVIDMSLRLLSYCYINACTTYYIVPSIGDVQHPCKFLQMKSVLLI